MITAARMGAVDRNAAALGIPRAKLMESSGNGVARAVQERTEAGAEVCLVCGRGNNGGDAMAAARFLSDRSVRVLLLGRPETIRSKIARDNWEALVASAVDTEQVRDSREFSLGNPDLIVDGMLGTGVTGELREPEASAAAAMADAEGTVVSVDVPSGVDLDSDTQPEGTVEADHVVTFHEMKPGLADLNATVEVVDIGIPDAAELFVGPGDLQTLGRSPDAHKGAFGEVLVIGGGPYTGAPSLAAQGAMRAGADLVRVACPAAIAREVQAYEAGLIVRPLEETPRTRIAPPHVEQLVELASEHDAVVVGPGLGDSQESLAGIREFLPRYRGTAVIDADALRVVSGTESDATVVCTPHAGEFQRMGGETPEDWRERMEAVTAAAAELDVTVLLKGPYDIISDGATTRVNRTGTPAMTVGGTGDVLAGVTGALVCRQPPVEAASIAAHANGRAGELAAKDYDTGLMATDLLTQIPAGLTDDGSDHI